jgi:hypothetical protein
VHDASLYLRLREHRGDGFREALEAVDDGDQHILDAAISQLVHDPQPKFGAFILLDPQAKNFLGAIGTDTKSNIHGFVTNRALIADLHPDRIEEHQGGKWLRAVDFAIRQSLRARRRSPR